MTLTAERSRSTTLALGAAVVSGALVALQQRVNGELAVELQDALLAAVVSFGTGLVAVVAVVAARPRARRALARVRDVPWWTRLGGLGGASLVAVGAAAAPEIGVALLTVGLVAGQTAGGLAVDRFGLAPGGAHLLTAPRVAGAALCLVAVGLGGLGRDAREADPVLLALVVGAGLLIAVQQALNGRVRRTTGDAAVATLVNFVVGTTALLAGLAVAVLLRGAADGDWPGPGQWYLYLGGPIGATFVGVAAVVVRRTGVLRLGLAVVAGQVVGALALDLAVPVTSTGIATTTVVSAALTLVAVAVSGLGVRRA
ncbi:MAG TPA: DMT family transporter [Mycobacteriales bacterium]|nr:DMT family transporter [Mycobacteriales bacterium]